MTPKDRIALAAYAEMLDDTVDLRNGSVGMDGGDPVRILLAEHDKIANELRRLRISQLRRMAHSIQGVIARNLISAETEDEFYRKKRHRNDRFYRFAKSCLAEIERLRGME